MRNLMVLAHWLAARVNVAVETYNGSTACIFEKDDGKRIIQIPVSWSYSNDPDAPVLLEGVIDHEALGHGRFTDLKAMEKVQASKKLVLNQFSKSVWNILEDVYIERKAIGAYPGIKSNLIETLKILMRRNFFGSPQSFENNFGPHSMLGGLLNVLRSRFIPGQDQVLGANAHFMDKLLTEKMGKVWLDVMNVAEEVENSTCTEDNIKLTIRIMKLLEDVAKSEPPPPPPPQQAEESQEPQSEDGEGGEDGSENQSDGEASSSNESTSESESSDGKGDEKDSGAGGESKDESDNLEGNPQQSSGSGQNDSGDPDERNSDSNSAQNSEASDGKPKKPKNKDMSKDGYSQEEIDQAQAILDNSDKKQQEVELGDAISGFIEQFASSGNRGGNLEDTTSVDKLTLASKKIATQVKSISDDLQDALIAESRSHVTTDLVGRRLNNRVLSRVSLGNPRIFRNKHEAEGLSTAVSFLGDVSGSMTEKLEDGITRFEALVGLMYGMGDVLAEFDVPFELSCYSSSYQTLKAFGEDWTQVRKREEVPSYMGGTITGAAMQKALTDLVVQPQERRLMIIATDGDTSDLDVLMSCYSEATEMGIEVATIIIGPMIRSVEALAAKFGFKAISTNRSTGLGKFAVQRVLECI